MPLSTRKTSRPHSLWPARRPFAIIDPVRRRIAPPICPRTDPLHLLARFPGGMARWSRALLRRIQAALLRACHLVCVCRTYGIAAVGRGDRLPEAGLPERVVISHGRQRCSLAACRQFVERLKDNAAQGNLLRLWSRREFLCPSNRRGIGWSCWVPRGSLLPCSYVLRLCRSVTPVSSSVGVDVRDARESVSGSASRLGLPLCVQRAEDPGPAQRLVTGV